MIKILYAMIDQEMDEGFIDDLYFAKGEYEIMLFRDEVVIEVNGKMKKYPPCHCILYDPGRHVHYYSPSGKLVYTWIRFDCDEQLYNEEGYLPFGIPVQTKEYDYFKVYFQAISDENYFRYPSCEKNMTDLMHIIFERLHEYAYGELYGYRPIFNKLRNAIYEYPEKDWTLDRMAEFVSLSPRSLQKIYKEYYKTSCSKDLINSRINRAKTLLYQTNLSVSEISYECGYKNVEHFCRQFKKNEGISPGEYRKLHSLNLET